VVFRQAPGVPIVPTVAASLSWDNVASRVAWSTALLGYVGKAIPQLEMGDPNGFVPRYSGLPSPDRKIKFWAELLIAVAEFESSWIPTDVYHEAAGENSIGLLQLSLQDQGFYEVSPRITDNDENHLTDPILNLSWGVTIFARLVAEDEVVASGASTASRGAARYWSTLRAGHKVELIRSITKLNAGL